uniref:Adenylosuccinate synthetase n=1 Tax=Syphacia muris TaxID=451379 RepID=A0A0N5AM68_9BILA
MANTQQKAPVVVILGSQFGDEGKGKIVDYLIDKDQIQVTARCQGGNNAGHTVVVNGRKSDFHLLPTGIINEKCYNVIGNGVVVNLDSLFAEVKHNEVDKLIGWEKRLMISECAHLVTSMHMQADGQQEKSLSTSKIGTTSKGIGPTYSSKCFRNGIRIGELLGDFEAFAAKFRGLLDFYKKQFPDVKVNVDEELSAYKKHAECLKRLGIVGDTVTYLDRMRSQGKVVLVEGANGAMLDIDFGTYPFVTSSNATVGGAVTGLGIPPTAIKEVIGVVKAYETRVGSGPFPTELLDKTGDDLQRIGHEVGVTTGRKRRCGWLDLFLLKRSNIINGFTALALTKLDILDSFDEIKVAVGYQINGKELTAPPCCAGDWEKVKVEYKVFKGWKTDISKIKKFDDLPENCKAYVRFVTEFIGVPIKWIGVGADREALIVMNS